MATKKSTSNIKNTGRAKPVVTKSGPTRGRRRYDDGGKVKK